MFDVLWRRLALVLLPLVPLLLWDASGLDLPLARLFGSAQGFAWRSHPSYVLLLHEVPRALSMAALLALAWGAWRPWGFLRPWDLAEFGGVAHYVSHWIWGVRDGGPGHCFPAGHASAGFGYVAGWFVLRRAVPRLATGWLLASLVLGCALGLSQQVRGAHYMSHTLWTAWFCWALGLLVDEAVQRWRSRTRARDTNLNET